MCGGVGSHFWSDDSLGLFDQLSRKPEHLKVSVCVTMSSLSCFLGLLSRYEPVKTVDYTSPVFQWALGLGWGHFLLYSRATKLKTLG